MYNDVFCALIYIPFHLTVSTLATIFNSVYVHFIVLFKVAYFPIIIILLLLLLHLVIVAFKKKIQHSGSIRPSLLLVFYYQSYYILLLLPFYYCQHSDSIHTGCSVVIIVENRHGEPSSNLRLEFFFCISLMLLRKECIQLFWLKQYVISRSDLTLWLWSGYLSRRRKTEFKPAKLRLKIDLVSHPARVEWLYKYIHASLL